jgi:hypothetical protein
MCPLHPRCSMQQMPQMQLKTTKIKPKPSKNRTILTIYEKVLLPNINYVNFE